MNGAISVSRVEELKRTINESLFELNYLLEENERPSRDVYLFFRKGELVFLGTLQEIMDYTGYAGGTLTGFGQPAYLKKNEGKPVNKLIKLGEK